MSVITIVLFFVYCYGLGFTISSFVKNRPVIGMDMYTCHWCSDVQSYQKKGFNLTAEENYNWLKSKAYEYIIIDGQTSRAFGADETKQ